MGYLQRRDDTRAMIALDVPKGTRIEPSQLEPIVDEDRHTAAYQFALMKLVSDFNSRSYAENAKKVARQHAGGIEICTDDEASDYAERTYEQGKAKIGRSIALSGMVDKSAMTPERVFEHDRATEMKNMVLRSIKDAENRAKKILVGGK